MVAGNCEKQRKKGANVDIKTRIRRESKKI
jgi:hypothetical protein